MIQRIGLVVALALLVGCAPDLGADSAGLVVTDQCEVAGLGVLPSGDLGVGRIVGGSLGVTGDWLHLSPAVGVVLATPDWILCRINGAILGDFGGPASVNGTSGYSYRVSIQDRGTPGDPTIVEGMPTVETVTATRHYRPRGFTDGSMTIVDRARVTIPSELPVTSGASGRGRAEVVFTRADTLGAIRCEYRGNGGRGHHGRDGHDEDEDDDEDDDDGDHDDDDDHGDRGGHGDYDRGHGDRGGRGHGGRDHGDRGHAAGGDRYVLHHCHSLPGLPTVGAGDMVDVTAVRVRVRRGARRAGDTTVTVNFDVTPLTVIEPPRDYYRIVVFDSAGDRVLVSDGILVHGDFVVEILP